MCRSFLSVKWKMLGRATQARLHRNICRLYWAIHFGVLMVNDNSNAFLDSLLDLRSLYSLYYRFAKLRSLPLIEWLPMRLCHQWVTSFKKSKWEYYVKYEYRRKLRWNQIQQFHCYKFDSDFIQQNKLRMEWTYGRMCVDISDVNMIRYIARLRILYTWRSATFTKIGPMNEWWKYTAIVTKMALSIFKFIWMAFDIYIRLLRPYFPRDSCRKISSLSESIFSIFWFGAQRFGSIGHRISCDLSHWIK